jgi:glycosyltransferase involved in cell wall biosynthesis
MVEYLVGNKQIRVALLSPGAIEKTGVAQFGTTFARVLSRAIQLDYISEAGGEYKGLRLKPISELDPAQYDVLHFQWGNHPLHLFEFSTLLKISSRKQRPLIVSTVHEADLGYLIGASEKTWRYRWYFRFRNGSRGTPKDNTDYAFFSHRTLGEILKRSDWVVVHSEYTKDRITAEHQLTASESAKIQVARLGIDWNDYAANEDNEKRLDAADSDEPMVFLYVGSLYPVKSIDKIIKALHVVRHFGGRNDFYLVVVGAGPEYTKLNYLAEALIPGHYCFAGSVPSVLPYYRLADVVVCPRAFSRGEISGLIPEACAAGKPIILPTIGGWNEYIDDLRGFPVGADDEIDYAKAVLRCLENPIEVREKGIKARHFAEECLSWQSQQELFLSMYSQVPQRF